jgi:hypothetical protein
MISERVRLEGTNFNLVDRPPKNRRRRPDELYWDGLLVDALLKTFGTDRALEVPLDVFHVSPAKGRLWKMGFRLLHRVVGGTWVHAWVENK